VYNNNVGVLVITKLSGSHAIWSRPLSRIKFLLIKHFVVGTLVLICLLTRHRPVIYLPQMTGVYIAQSWEVWNFWWQTC